MKIIKPRENSLNEAERKFIEFVDAMHNWEVKSFSSINIALKSGENASTARNEAKNELSLIFDRYLEPRSGDRRRLVDANVGFPCDYDANRDTIFMAENDGKKAVFLYQQKVGSKSKLRFTLKLISGTWFVHKAEIFFEYKNKWDKFVI